MVNLTQNKPTHVGMSLCACDRYHGRCGLEFYDFEGKRVLFDPDCKECKKVIDSYKKGDSFGKESIMDSFYKLFSL